MLQDMKRAAFDFDFTLFDAGTAARVTSASETQQWNWRRSGYIPKHDGHAKYNIIDICELWVMAALSKRGVGPQVSRKYSRDCAKSAAWFALYMRPAWAGNFDVLPQSSNTHDWQTQNIVQISESFGRQPPMQSPIIGKLSHGANIAIFGKDQTALPVHSFLRIWQDGEFDYTNHRDPLDFGEDELGALAIPLEKLGLVSVLPLKYAGQLIAHELGAPLVTLRKSDGVRK